MVEVTRRMFSLFVCVLKRKLPPNTVVVHLSYGTADLAIFHSTVQIVDLLWVFFFFGRTNIKC